MPMPARVRPDDPESHRRFAIFDALLQSGLLLLALGMIISGPDTDLYNAGFGIFIAVILVFSPLALWSTYYLFRIYWYDARTRRSWLLLRDALIALRLAPVVLFLGVLGTLRLIGVTHVDWAGPLLVVSLAIVAEIPTYMAAVYWLRRRTAGDGTPPPIND